MLAWYQHNQEKKADQILFICPMFCSEHIEVAISKSISRKLVLIAIFQDTLCSVGTNAHTLQHF
jgi:hypothetical protein